MIIYSAISSLYGCSKQFIIHPDSSFKYPDNIIFLGKNSATSQLQRENTIVWQGKLFTAMYCTDKLDECMRACTCRHESGLTGRRASERASECVT